MLKIFRALLLLMLLVFVGLCGWLYARPPELLLVGTSYSAKIVCSNRFIAGRDPGEILSIDVQAPGHPLLKFVSAVVNEEEKAVTAHIFGFFAGATSVYREGLGCTNLPRGYEASALAGLPPAPAPLPKPGSEPWPDGDGPLEASDMTAKLDPILADTALTGPNMRAVVVIKDGRLLDEVYGAGFTKDTPLLGWSMTKTVNAAIAGRLMAEGRLGFDDRNLLPEWAGDSRKDIRLADLMGMESGLRFNEDYGDVSDVTRMLYLSADMAGFSAGQPAEAAPATVFNYSTGTSVLISRIWMNRFDDPSEAMAYPGRALFGPLGMASAVLETDVAGTYVGGSYLYATARDWAKFAELLRRDGEWKGTRLLSEDFMRRLKSGTASSKGLYTGAQAWRSGPDDKPSSAHGLPEDTIWMQGHDGQTIAIIPSEGLIVLRMGLTPSKLGYVPQPLVKAVLAALKG
jgi:CubicO group peptidase (beta-lactamase class C family)